MGSGGDRLKVGTNRPVVNGRGLHWQLHMTSISDIYRKLYYFKIYIRPFLLDPKVTVYLRRPYREVALNKEFIYKF